MIDNAVAHYEYLREQGKKPSEALEHTVQRFGVDRKVMMDRVNGKVASHKDTMTVLAEAKAHLEDEFADPSATARILADLYTAVTGEPS